MLSQHVEIKMDIEQKFWTVVDLCSYKALQTTDWKQCRQKLVSIVPCKKEHLE